MVNCCWLILATLCKNAQAAVIPKKDNRLSQAQFVCMGCGFRENADLNAMKNVLAAGYTVLSLNSEVALAARVGNIPAFMPKSMHSA